MNESAGIYLHIISSDDTNKVSTELPRPLKIHDVINKATLREIIRI